MLDKLVVPTKEVEIEYPGLEGFKVKISAASGKVSRDITKASQVTEFDPTTRRPVERLDEDLFAKNLAKTIIKGWRGLTIDKLESLMLVGEHEDPTQEVPYSEANAEILLNNSHQFTLWVNEVMFDLEQFRSKR